MNIDPWTVESLDHSDTKWGLCRSVINVEGRYENKKYPLTFDSYEDAAAVANIENGGLSHRD
jgi:hypothetical protein